MVRWISFPLLVIFTSLLPVSGSTIECNKLNFLVYKGADRIGTLTISQQIEPDHITYTLNSDVSIDLIVEFNIEENIKDVFENGYLQSSVHTRYVNGSLRANNTLIREHNVYKVTDGDASVKYLHEGIQFSVLSLYFDEPTAGRMVYSENFRELVKLRRIAEHTYSVELPNGNITTYYYSNNKMQSVVSQTRFGVIKFVGQN